MSIFPSLEEEIARSHAVSECDPPSEKDLFERRDETGFPYTDDCTGHLVEGAVLTLLLVRAPWASRNAAARLSCLESLRAEVDCQLHLAVADARSEGLSWSTIGERLLVGESTARRRYRAFVLASAECEMYRPTPSPEEVVAARY